MLWKRLMGTLGSCCKEEMWRHIHFTCRVENKLTRRFKHSIPRQFNAVQERWWQISYNGTNNITIVQRNSLQKQYGGLTGMLTELDTERAKKHPLFMRQNKKLIKLYSRGERGDKICDPETEHVAGVNGEVFEEDDNMVSSSGQGVGMERSYWDFVKMAQGGASAIYGLH